MNTVNNPVNTGVHTQGTDSFSRFLPVNTVTTYSGKRVLRLAHCEPCGDRGRWGHYRAVVFTVFTSPSGIAPALGLIPVTVKSKPRERTDPLHRDAMGPSGECALRGTRSLGLSPRDRNLDLEKPPEGHPRHGERN